MESFATPYPVIFYDGEFEHDKGQVGVHSVLSFKRFQSLLSQKVGFPAGQLSAVFVCSHTAKGMDTKRQKLPINENTNFNIILNQHNPMWDKDCHFLVSVKKPKRERKSMRRRSADVELGKEDDLLFSCSDASFSKEGRQDFFGSGDGERMQDALMNQESMAISPKETVACMQQVESMATSLEETATRQRAHIESGTLHANLMKQRHGNVLRDGGPHGEKVLLRREHRIHGSLASQTNLLPPYDNTVRQNLPSQQAEMWSVSSLPHQRETLKSVRQSSPPHQIEAHKSVQQSSSPHHMESGKSVRHGSPLHGAEKRKTGRSLSQQQTERWKNDQAFVPKESIEGRETHRYELNVLPQQFSQVGAVVSSSAEGYHQERYQGVAMARSAALLHQNGALNFSNTGMSISPFAPKEGVPALAYPISTSALLLSRVSHRLAPGTTAALQQAQAHYLNAQAQHSEHMHLNLHVLPRLKGVACNSTACEDGSRMPSGVCQYCCMFRERNVDPTPFHLCVHDRVTNGFRGRPPAGPIERPAKRVEAAA
eukprot:c23570_g1_i1 orf=251-1870(+)